MKRYHESGRGIPLLPVLLSLSLVVAAAPAAERIRISAEQQAAFGVQLSAPEAADDSLSRRYPAKVAVPNRQLRVVSAPQAGILEALLVAEGEPVKEGQVLARLRSPELLQAQSDYLAAASRQELARSKLTRDRKLFQEGIVAERRLLESKAAFREADTASERARQRLGLAGMSEQDLDTLRRTRRLSSTLPVRAPIAGVVLAQSVSTGQAVAAADPLYRIGRLDPLWLEIRVPVDQVGPVREGGVVRLPVPGTQGRIITVGRMVHGTDQGVLVRAEIHDGVQSLHPGQFVEVQLAAASAGEAWRVDAASVLRKGGKEYVLVARDNGFEPVPVTVLASEERSMVVSGALQATDRVVSKGTAALKAAWLGGSR